MIIAFFPNTIKKESEIIAKNICKYLLQNGVQVVAESEIAESMGMQPLSSISPLDINFIISLGGDGTILRLTQRHPEIQAPIVAINLGGLGFMADISQDAIYLSLKNLLEGKYWIQNRIMMEGTFKNSRNFAVNEILIHRAQNHCLIDLALYVDGKYLNTFSADGIILSTPTGSTAYSLAAGGPILTPELDAFVLTPICPHTISNRPIVFMPDLEIRIEYISSHDPIEITYDGFTYCSMSKGECLNIMRSQRVFRLVCMPDHDYFSTLRTKLGWAGKLRQ